MKKNLLVLTIYLFLSLVVTYPLVFHLNTLIVDPYDSLLITWIQNWLIHWPGLSANIFYPYANTLAFSDYHVVSALIGAPFVLLTGEPLASFNVNLILGLALTAFSGYLLSHHLTKREPVSFLVGVLLSFSTIHLNYIAHPQLFHLWLVVLPWYFFLTNHKKSFVFLFVLAVLNSPLNFYFLLFSCLLFRRHLRWLISAALISIPALLPYYLVSRQFSYQRPINDAIHFSLQFLDLANVSTLSRLTNFVHPIPDATSAYIGGVFLVLTAIMLRRAKSSPWLWIAGVAFILSLGPALHLFRNTVHLGPIPAIPLPYALFYYLLPGFSGFRTPSRWILLTATALVFALATHFAKRINWPWAILLSILVLIEINFPFKYATIPSVREFPPEQVWLKTHYVGAPIIQFPIYGWWDNPGVGQETLREYYSTTHWHPMFNGYSGFSPREWETRVQWLQANFPSPETIDYLQGLKIKLVLIPSDWGILCCQDKLKLVATFPNTKIYAFNDRTESK